MKYILEYEDFLFTNSEVDDIVYEIFADREFLSKFIKNTQYFTIEESRLLEDFLLNSDEIVNEGIKDVIHNTWRKIKKSPHIIAHGIHMAGHKAMNAIKTNHGIQRVAHKIANAFHAVKDFVVTILEEFTKAYLFFTKANERDIKVAASWTIKKFPNVRKAAKLAKPEEKEFFEDTIVWFNHLKEQLKMSFRQGVQHGIKESFYDSEFDIYELLNEGNEIAKVKNATNHLLGKEMDFGKIQNVTHSMPKGTVGKMKESVNNAINTVVNIIDTLEKNFLDYQLTTFASAVKIAGGPEPPRNGFPHTSVVYTYAGSHSQGNLLSAGVSKNWKRALNTLMRTGANLAVGGVAFKGAKVGGYTLPGISFFGVPGVVGLGIGVLMQLIKIVKKTEITAMILRMSAGDEKMVHIPKTQLKNFNKDYFSKNTE